MTATLKAAISPFAQAKTEFDSNPMHFLNEDLASVPASGIPEEFRKLSGYMPVIVLVPKSAVDDKTTQKKPGPNKSVTGSTDTSDVCLPQADLGSNGFCGEALGIHFIFKQLVTDSHSIQKASRIGFLCHNTPILGAIRSEKDRSSQHFNNRERKTHRTSEDRTHSSLLRVP